MNLERMAFDIFGDYFMKRRSKFSTLREDLMKARIFIPVERWLSKAVLYSIIAAFSFIIVYILKIFLSLISRFDFSIGLTDIVLIITGILISFISTFLGFYFFPRIKAWERKGKIDRLLPYAIGYISSMASIGVVPYEIFKKLSEAEETYGEVSNEAKLVVRDVELLGADFITALKTLVSITPSKRMRTFLQGAVTTALSGGEMGSYFINTAREYMEERRRKYRDFIETLILFAEIYVAGLVAAPLILVVVLAIMCFLGGASLSTLAAIIYIIIPLGSIAFIFLIDTLSEQ